MGKHTSATRRERRLKQFGQPADLRWTDSYLGFLENGVWHERIGFVEAWEMRILTATEIMLRCRSPRYEQITTPWVKERRPPVTYPNWDRYDVV